MAINDDILAWARPKLGEVYGDGECWTYVEDAVVSAGGKSSRDQTPNFGADANYVWGRTASLGALTAGNLLQFRNYSWVSNTTVKITFADGAWETLPTGASQSRPHHSAIVEAVGSDGVITVLEQNVPRGGAVTRVELRLRSLSRPRRTTQERHRHPQTGRMELATVETTINEVVTGQVWAYQAETP